MWIAASGACGSGCAGWCAFDSGCLGAPRGSAFGGGYVGLCTRVKFGKHVRESITGEPGGYLSPRVCGIQGS